MKLWLAGGWFLACVLVGCGIYRQHWNKVKTYTDWVNFCDYLQQAIGFALQPLPQVIAGFLPTCRSDCYSALLQYGKLLQQKIDLTRDCCRTCVNDESIAEFLYQLGRTGRETEQAKITAFRVVLETKKNNAVHHLKMKASIILKLLIIIGIAGGILWM